MESIFYYKNKEKEITKLLKDDNFMRISYLIKECKNIGFDKEGNLLYVKGDTDEIEKLEKELKDLGVEKMTGSSLQDTLDVIKNEEDNAAQGMGMIFNY